MCRNRSYLINQEIYCPLFFLVYIDEVTNQVTPLNKVTLMTESTACICITLHACARGKVIGFSICLSNKNHQILLFRHQSSC